MDLITWLAKTLQDRRYSYRKLAKESGVSHALISRVLSGEVPASADFCVKIAEALGEPPERLLRLAGILPPVEDNPDLQEVIDIYNTLPANKQQALLEFLRYLKSK